MKPNAFNILIAVCLIWNYKAKSMASEASIGDQFIEASLRGRMLTEFGWSLEIIDKLFGDTLAVFEEYHLAFEQNERRLLNGKQMSIGVSSGGGGSEGQTNFLTNAEKVLSRMKAHPAAVKHSQLLGKLESVLRIAPPKIDTVEKLKYCDTGSPVNEKKDAWTCPGLTRKNRYCGDGTSAKDSKFGFLCPGKVQLLSSFNLNNDALICHELTRLTVEWFDADDQFQICINDFELNKKYINSFIMEEHWMKGRVTRQYLQDREEYYRLVGVVATNLQETQSHYILTVVMRIFDSSDSNPMRHLKIFNWGP